MVHMILCTRAAKGEHGCKEQIFGLSGRGEDGTDLREQLYETYAAPYVQQITSAESAV